MYSERNQKINVHSQFHIFVYVLNIPEINLRSLFTRLKVYGNMQSEMPMLIFLALILLALSPFLVVSEFLKGKGRTRRD